MAAAMLKRALADAAAPGAPAAPWSDPSKTKGEGKGEGKGAPVRPQLLHTVSTALQSLGAVRVP